MTIETEVGNIHQYCFSIRNRGIVETCIERFKLKNIFLKHQVIIVTMLPKKPVLFLENWMQKEFENNDIKVSKLKLDFISQSGILNFAVFADSRQNIIDKLRKLDGFSSVGDETEQLSPY